MTGLGFHRVEHSSFLIEEGDNFLGLIILLIFPTSFGLPLAIAVGGPLHGETCPGLPHESDVQK